MSMVASAVRIRSASRALLVIGVLAALTSVTSGCTPDTRGKEDNAEPAIGPVIPVRSDSEIVLPLDSYLQTADQQRAVSTAVNVVGRECMKEFGLDWPTGASLGGGESARNARRYWIVDAKAARIEGYHVPANTRRQQQLEAQRAGQQGPTNEAMNVWAGRGEKTFNGRPVPAGGCAGEATRKLTAGAPGADPALAQQLQLDSFSRTKADSRVVSAFAAWSSCMKAQGFDYPDPSAAINDQRWQSEQISDQEVAVAVADVACKIEANVAGIMLAVETAYQKRLIDKHVTDLDAIKKYLEIEVGNAQRVVAAGGG